MTGGLQLGRPGIYRVTTREPESLTEVRLDVAGFVGVALRGPVDTATPVISWADYERRFGGLEPNVTGRDRLLPHAVQAFFAQGGRRAWVIRVAPVAGADEPTAEAATARFQLSPPSGGSPSKSWELTAADEGEWGTALDIRLDFAAGVPLAAALLAPDQLVLPPGGEIPEHSLLRIRSGVAAPGLLRWVQTTPKPAYQGRLVALDAALPINADAQSSSTTRVRVEVVTGTLVVTDPSGSGRSERITRLGLHPEHVRFPPTVLPTESLLVRTVGDWAAALRPDPTLVGWPARAIHPGQDRTDRVDRDSFFDPGEANADPLDDEPHRGVDLMGRQDEIGILCIPDLTWRSRAIPESTVVSTAKPISWPPHCWCPPQHVEPDLVEPAPPERSLLDGTDDVDLAEIIARQQRAVAVAELRRRFVVLLDVPSGLPTTRITDWRAAFDSSFAAAYHPWLGVPRPGTGARPTAVLVPPSAFAAGIMAERERRLGLSRGPANQLAFGAVRAADAVSDALADRLHLLSINVFGAERDGFRLAAARTLSSDPDYYQLSVRRLMTMLAITLRRYGEGLLVFEPNTVELRGRLTNAITELLRGLHRRGAFSGATEEESFFVRCDGSTNPPQSLVLGRLIAEVGVAPAAPLEYIVLRIASDGEGGLVVDEQSRIGPTAGVATPEVSIV